MTSQDNVPTPEAVRDAATARAFIRWALRVMGIGFHPDTRGKEYVTHATGRRVFNAHDARLFDEQMTEVFAFLDDPYAVAIEEARDLGLWEDAAQ